MLELEDIQHILLTRVPALSGRYELLTFRNPAGGRAWLAGILAAVDAPEDGVERGIAAFVICASLIRQFEFLQHVWANDRNFHELATNGTRSSALRTARWSSRSRSVPSEKRSAAYRPSPP